MTASFGTVHMICGKIGAGKSTLAAQLAAAPGAVLIAEDDWLAALFGDVMKTPRDYVRCAARLRQVMSPHVAAVLGTGATVVLDFPANTVDSRAWMARLVRETGAAHQMHVLMVPDALCLDRLRARNAAGHHPFAVTDAQFHEITKHYQEPSPSEGFNIIRH